MRYKSFFALILISVIFTGCSASYQIVKSGSELQEMGNHYGASLKYIEALKIEPTYEKAILKLCEVAKMAYDQKLSLSQNIENSSNYKQALREYIELQDFLSHANSNNCVSFPTINVENKISQMKSSASEEYYKKAEIFFKNGNYLSSIKNYNQSLVYNSPYKDCTKKISESYYRLGKISQKQNNFREAAKYFILTNQRTEGYKDASQLAVKLYYALGKYFLSKKECRNAWQDFGEVKKINPNYKKLSSLINSANECSVTRIAFMHFDNKTGRNIAGMAIEDFIFDDLKTKMQKNSSRFVQLLDREDVTYLLEEQKMGMAGITDKYVSFKQLEGVDYLIFGKITQVRSDHQRLRCQQKQSQGEESYKCTKRGKSGKTYETWCYRKVPVYYEICKDKISIAIAGSTKVISVATGATKVQFSINEEEDDAIEYADNIHCRCDIDNTNIKEEITQLSNERQDLVDVDSLSKNIIDRITEGMSSKILSKIDNMPKPSDPTSLKF